MLCKNGGSQESNHLNVIGVAPVIHLRGALWAGGQNDERWRVHFLYCCDVNCVYTKQGRRDEVPTMHIEEAFGYLIEYPRMMIAAAARLKLLDPLLVSTVILPMVSHVATAQPRVNMSRSEFSAKYPGIEPDGVVIVPVEDCDVVISECGISVYRAGQRAAYKPMNYLCTSTVVYFGAGLFSCLGSERLFRVVDGAVLFENARPEHAFIYKITHGGAVCYVSQDIMMHPGFRRSMVAIKEGTLHKFMWKIDVVCMGPCVEFD